VTASNSAIPHYTIQPYHMNGLNWRLAPDDPGRDNIAVVTGFMPSWWTAEYGITFGAEFHLNPEVHRATLARMEAILRQRFGDLPNFFCGDDYARAYCMERRYGDALIPVLFGGAVSFEDASGHPYAPSQRLSAAEAEALAVPDLANHPIVASLLPRHGAADRRIAGELGFEGAPKGLRIAGELGFEGAINIAYKLRDYALFTDMLDAPGRAHHIFEVTWQTIDAFVHRVRDWQDPAGRRPSYFVNCNCLVNMISPRLYRQQLLEFDQRFRHSFDLVGIHTCNWVVDPYLDALAEIPGLAYLDMGEGSDLERVHRLFPDLCPSVFVHPVRLLEMSERQIGRHITELGRRIGRGYILLSDLEAGTRDSQIRAAYEAAARLA
jgi:hypothetical protein